MAKLSISASRLAASKALTQRLAFLGLLAAAIGLMILGKAEAPLVERVRMAVVDGIVPLLDVLSRPSAAIAELAGHVDELIELRVENARLREENERLLNWQSVARRLEAENQSLRVMLKLPAEPGISFVSARVVGETGGAFVRSILVNVGSEDGVKRGRAAVTGEGLIGRVAEVGRRSARILLLTDLNSQLPVLLESSRERAILSGDNSPQPRLNFVSAVARPQLGERIVTSGHGGVFPPGLPVGTVVSVTELSVRVRPFADLGRVEHVRLVDYGLDGVLSVPAPPPMPRQGSRR